MIEGISVSLALVAGGLAALNPCGFVLLPAYLSVFVGADESDDLGSAGRVAQGLWVGALVTAGFLALFTVVGLPVALGAGAVARALPWAGIALGLGLLAMGLIVLAGGRVGLPLPRTSSVGQGRQAKTMILFGVSYGVASLGCTLPVFLTLVGSSVGTGTIASVVNFIAYGVGMAVVLMALSVAAALARRGLARALGRLLPYVPRVTGAVLALAGAYLAYYWWRIRFGPSATLASDPIVGRALRYTSRLTSMAEGAGWRLIAVAALVVAVSAGVAWWQWSRRRDRLPLDDIAEGAPVDAQ